MKRTTPNYLASPDYSVAQQRIHCWMRLASCPTYQEAKLERNSRRGRIAWMRSIGDGSDDVDRAFGEEMYYCLGCLACVSSRPIGVNYPTLFESRRGQIESDRVLARPQRTYWHWLTVKFLFMRARALRSMGRAIWLYQASGLRRFAHRSPLVRLLPQRLREPEPRARKIRHPFSDVLIAIRESAPTPGYEVGLLTGCVQDLGVPGMNRDTVDVMLPNGCTVITPRSQHCCGSLHAHNGEIELAKDAAFPYSTP
jgi:glycolate oxidase iron-sulfur subunit